MPSGGGDVKFIADLNKRDKAALSGYRWAEILILIAAAAVSDYAALIRPTPHSLDGMAINSRT